MALKKLLSAQEAVVVAQRPLLFAATDMVDAIAREEDVGDFMQARSKSNPQLPIPPPSHLPTSAPQHLTSAPSEPSVPLRPLRPCAPVPLRPLRLSPGSPARAPTTTQELTCETQQGAEIQQQIDDQARQLSWLEQQQALLAEPASPATPRRAATLGVAPPGQLREVDRAAKLTKEFVQLSTDGFGPGLALRDATTGQRLVAQRLEQLELGLTYLTPLELRLVRGEGDVLLLEDTPVTLPRAAEVAAYPSIQLSG